MKIYAMYLPQFHRVKENDEWWGEGFTDWVSARKAEPLYEGHYQPRVPLNENYYDLLEKETIQWQADMMHKYGIDGMCIYHYWFKDGKQILEKPAENLLQWKDVQMPFCFYWANETWARSWSNIKGANVWSDIEEKANNKDKKILLEQSYGDEKEWVQHFEYLLPFFRDSRYIKIDGKPLFFIYKVKDIICLREMILCWRQLAKDAGIGDIYFVGANADTGVTTELDSFLFHEPANSVVDAKKINNSFGITTFDYSNIWERILEAQPVQRKTYYSGFVGYDETPRRGKKGYVIENATSEIFEDYLMQLLAKSEVDNNEFILLNAWNEWGEGMYLEPDKCNAYAYLEAVKNAKIDYKKYIEMYQEKKKSRYKNLSVLQQNCDKYERYLNLFDQWMNLKEKGYRVSDWLKRNNVKKVAIYGYGILGRHLINELSGTEIEMVCVVDKQSNETIIPLFKPSDRLPQIDMMIVTSYYFYDDIVSELGDGDYEIISFEKIISELG